MKEKIIETSIELFDQKGFKETSIQDIVETMMYKILCKAFY